MKAIPATAELWEWFETTLDKLLPMASSIIRKGDDHQPLLAVFPKVGIAAGPAFVPAVGSKDEYNVVHRALSSQFAVHAAILITEAWIVTTENEMPDMTKSLEHHPRRTEVLLFNCLSHGMQLIAMLDIERPGNTLGERRIFDPGKPGSIDEGRMVLNRPVKH